MNFTRKFHNKVGHSNRKILNICLAIILITSCCSEIYQQNKQNERKDIHAEVSSGFSIDDEVKWELGTSVYLNGKKYVTLGTNETSNKVLSDSDEGLNKTYEESEFIANGLKDTSDRIIVSDSAIPTPDDIEKAQDENGALVSDFGTVSQEWWLNSIDVNKPYKPTKLMNADNTVYNGLLTWDTYEKANQETLTCDQYEGGTEQGVKNTIDYAFSNNEYIDKDTSFTGSQHRIAHVNIPISKFKDLMNNRKIYLDNQCRESISLEQMSALVNYFNEHMSDTYYNNFTSGHGSWDELSWVKNEAGNVIGGSNGDCLDLSPIPYSSGQNSNQSSVNVHYENMSALGTFAVLNVLYNNKYLIYPHYYIRNEGYSKSTENATQQLKGQWSGTMYCKSSMITSGVAAIRPIIDINIPSILFASDSNLPEHTSNTKLFQAENRILKEMVSDESRSYKFTVEDSNMAVTNIQNTSSADHVVKQNGTKFILKPGATTLKLKVSTAGSGASAPNKIAAYTTETDGAALYGEVGNVSGSTSDVEIDLSNIMDTTKPGSKTIQLYAEQENGAFKTDYLSEKYEITLTIPVDQTLGLKKDTVLSGTYGETLTLTAVVNEEEVDRTWDPERELIASIAPGYEEIGEVTSSIWDKETGMTKIEIKPKKSGVLKLKLSKESDPDNGITVNNNDMLSADIKVEKRKVTLQPKAIERRQYERYAEPSIDVLYSEDDRKAGLVNEDTLPDTIKIQTTDAKDTDTPIPTQTVSETKRLTTPGTWTQKIDKSAYDSDPMLDDRYEFKLETNTYVVTPALQPDDGYIEVTPECTYKEEDVQCWNSSTVTIKPSQTAIDAGYDLIKNTTGTKDQIEQDETGFVKEITIAGPSRIKLEDIHYNLKNSKDDVLSKQGTVGRTIRIDETIPARIDVTAGRTATYTIVEAILEAMQGNAGGIRFDSLPIQLTISAEDDESGIRYIKAYELKDDDTQGAELPLIEDKNSYVENSSIAGVKNAIDGDKTYKKKVYTAALPAGYSGRVKISAVNNAGIEAYKTTNKLVHETTDEAVEGMLLEAGSTAVDNGDGTYKITKRELQADTVMWPLKIQAPKSGIKSIRYYITDETDTKELSGTQEAPIDVTEAGYGIKVLSDQLAWDDVNDNQLDVALHDEAVVSLQEAIENVKGRGDAILHVHARLESNAGNSREEVFRIQVLYQEIEWSQEMKDTDPTTTELEMEATYGTPIELIAEMKDKSNRWSSSQDFIFTLKAGDEGKAKLIDPVQERWSTSKNPAGTEKGRGKITLIPLTGDDAVIHVKVKKTGDNEYVDSNEIEVTVKLKSKPIDITADPTDTYDVKTGEEHPKLTWKITDSGKEDGGLVKDTEAGIEDTELDFGLKATVCVDGGSCGITDLSSYEQRTNTKEGTRINETGEWKLEFQYDENKKDDDSPQSVFNKKYAIHFIDHSSGDTTSAQRTLKVTQDAFDETWYTITAPKDLVKADTDAWNTSAVTIQPTDQAITKDLKERTYTKIIDDGKKDKGDIAHPETWSWADTIVHTKDDGTEPKTYEVRFRDPTSGAFTEAGKVKRSVRVDETAPIQPFIRVNDTAEAVIPDAGLVQGKRFSKDGLRIQAGIVDKESGIRSFNVYKIYSTKEGRKKEEIPKDELKITDVLSKTVPGVSGDGTAMAVEKRTAEFTITEEYKGSIKIVAVNNAGLETTYETGQLINEPQDNDKLTITKDETEAEKIPDTITRDNYLEDYQYPWKLEAPVSGIRTITYTMQIDNDDEKDPKTLKKETAELTKVFKVADAEDKAVEQGTAETTPTYGLDRHAVSYGTYFSIKPYIDEMIKEKVELATITIKIELESNAGNKKIETFRLPVDMMLNDPQDYIITPKRVELKRNDEETEAIGKAEVQLKTIEQDTLPAGLDITQYFNIYTPPTITLHNEGSYHKDTFTVSVYDEAGKKLTEDKNVLASLNYVHKETAAFTLKTVLITEPAKDKDRGEYKGVMTYTVKYGKEDKEHQPKEDTP